MKEINFFAKKKHIHLLGNVVSGVVMGQVLRQQPIHSLPEGRGQIAVRRGNGNVPNFRHLAEENHLQACK